MTQIDDGVSLEPSVVAFVDVLGTRGMEADQEEELGRLIAARSRAAEFLPVEPGYEIASFTDNTLLRWRRCLDDGSVNPALAWLPDELAALQLAFSVEGILVRGGVASGMLAMGQDFIFGDALNRAYLTETRAAFWPRIAVTESAIEPIAEAVALAADDPGTEFGSLLVDEDGMAFVHYLNWAQNSNAADFFVQLHRDWVVTRFEEQRARPAVSEKLRWSIAYHNFSVGQMGLADDLLIDAAAAARSFSSM